MKPIEDYFKNKDLRVKYLDGYDIHINRDLLLEIIKEVQTDAIKSTVQTCADSANIKNEYFFTGDYSGHNRVIVDKSSILEVAEKLIKELE